MRLLPAPVLAPALLLPLLAVPATPAAAADAPLLAAQAPDGVVLLDPGTGARRRLVVPGGLDPAVSPDGTRLAFGLRDGSAVQLWTSALDGSDRRRLTSGPAVSSTPDWSPDGTRLALTRYTVPAGTPSLAVVDADGTDGRVVPGSTGLAAASWSPDGTLLAFSSRQGVGVVGPDGRGRTLLPGAAGTPDWSPDGRSLALAVQGGDEGYVLRYDLATGRTQRLTEFAGYHVLWQRAVHAPAGGLYTDIVTESFPDASGTTTSGRYLEHRDADGTSRSAFRTADGTSRPGPQAAPPPARDGVVPLPVAATATAAPGRVDVETGARPEPDAAGVVVRYALGDVPPATPQDGLPGGRSVTGRLTVADLPPSTRVALSVWPLDWSGEVGPRSTAQATTPAQEPTALELTATPEPVPHGGQVVLRARLTRHGQPFAGAPVALYGHRDGQPDALLSRLTTDGDGRVAVPRTPSADTRYTLRYEGEGDLLPSAASVLVHDRAVLRAAPSPTMVRRGGSATVRVQVRPASPGGTVRLYQLLGDRTVAQTSGRQDRYGVVRLSVATSVRGTHRLLAYAGAPGHGEGSAEARVTVR